MRQTTYKSSREGGRAAAFDDRLQAGAQGISRVTPHLFRPQALVGFGQRPDASPSTLSWISAPSRVPSAPPRACPACPLISDHKLHLGQTESPTVAMKAALNSPTSPARLIKLRGLKTCPISGSKPGRQVRTCRRISVSAVVCI